VTRDNIMYVFYTILLKSESVYFCVTSTAPISRYCNRMQEIEIAHCRVHKSCPIHYLNPAHTLTCCFQIHLAITLAFTPTSPPLNFADPHSPCSFDLSHERHFQCPFYFPLLEAVAKERLMKKLQAGEDLTSSDL
jgi:hypothetical protein